jgi:4-hydroxybenzoyl-CoA thioesterase
VKTIGCLEINVVAFTSVQKIRFDDVDGAGIVYYPQYFHLCHKAFEDFFDAADSISYPRLINELRRGFPTVAIQSEFSAPLRYGDVAAVSLSVKKIGRSSTSFSYSIHREQDSVLCFSACITLVFMDLEKHKVLPIPDDIRSLFESIAQESEGIPK